MTKQRGRLVALAATLAASLAAQQFETPFRIEAGGKPIDVEIGHAAPYVVDFDGDGVRDLLVGQFGQGRCRIYKNTGTNQKPAFGEFTWFEAGGKPAEVGAS
ncbi:MAG TPA: VCBS repeat-containing protein [Planctomycetota bacterium]|nr:VCBS repeat-containing protein [Planctomycetota bacterium]